MYTKLEYRDDIIKYGRIINVGVLVLTWFLR